MKKSLLILAGFCFLQGNSQNVGINTTTPEASLDVNGNLRIQDVPISSAAASQKFLVLDSNNKVEQVYGNYASAVNTTIAKASKKNGFNLLTATTYLTWQKIDFDVTSINPGNNFKTIGSFYKVPSDGIYEVTYYFKYGTGLTASLLSSTKIGILKKTGSEFSVLDERKFEGVSIGLGITGFNVLELAISSSTINSIYVLNKNDELSFEIVKGAIELGILNSSSSEVIIKKISN